MLNLGRGSGLLVRRAMQQGDDNNHLVDHCNITTNLRPFLRWRLSLYIIRGHKTRQFIFTVRKTKEAYSSKA